MIIHAVFFRFRLLKIQVSHISCKIQNKFAIRVKKGYGMEMGSCGGHWSRDPAQGPRQHRIERQSATPKTPSSDIYTLR